MAIQVTCENCGAGFRTDDSAAGKQAPCPKCGSTIQIPTAGQEQETYEAEDAGFGNSSDDNLAGGNDRRPCPMCGEMIVRDAVKCRYCGEVLDSSLKGVLHSSGQLDDTAWSKVRSGLHTIYICMGIAIVAGFLIAILAGVANFMVDAQNGGDVPPLLLVVFALIGLLMISAGIGMLVGFIRCAYVPRESGAQGFASAAAICAVVNVLLSIAARALESEAISGIGSLISLVGWLLFILFIKRSAAYLNDSSLKSSAARFLMFCGALFVVALLLGILKIVGFGAIAKMGSVPLLVCCVIGFVWFLRLIRGLRTTIDRYLGA